jgi:hypothetical protein
MPKERIHGRGQVAPLEEIRNAESEPRPHWKFEFVGQYYGQRRLDAQTTGAIRARRNRP